MLPREEYLEEIRRLLPEVDYRRWLYIKPGKPWRPIIGSSESWDADNLDNIVKYLVEVKPIDVPEVYRPANALRKVLDWKGYLMSLNVGYGRSRNGIIRYFTGREVYHIDQISALNRRRKYVLHGYVSDPESKTEVFKYGYPRFLEEMYAQAVMRHFGKFARYFIV